MLHTGNNMEQYALWRKEEDRLNMQNSIKTQRKWRISETKYEKQHKNIGDSKRAKKILVLYTQHYTIILP
jgi:hypothetical protein